MPAGNPRLARPLSVVLPLFFCASALLAGCSKSTKVAAPVTTPSPAPLPAWTALPGPSTTMARGIVSLSPSTLVAGGASGTWRSTDSGVTWERVDMTPVNAVAKENGGSTLFAATATGVLASSDGGATWNSFNVGLTGSPSVLAIATAPWGVYAGLAGGGVALYAATSDHWVDASVGLPVGASVSALGVSSSFTVLAGTTAGSVFEDNGSNWGGLLTQRAVPILAVNRTLLAHHVLSGTADGLYVDDSRAVANVVVNAFTTTSTEDFAGTNHGIYRSSNEGTSWTQVLGGLPDGTPVTGFTALSGTLFASTAGRGVYRSADGGATWSSSGPPDAHVTGLFRNGGTILAGTTRGIEVSTSDGATWSGASLDSIEVNCFTASSTARFAGTFGLGVARSTDDLHWTYANSGLPVAADVFRLAADGTAVIADCVGDPVGLYRSVDDGATWTPVSSLPGHENVTDVVSSNGKFFACEFGASSGVFVSTDHGATWTAANGGVLTGKAVTALGADAASVVATTTAGAYITTDGGASWSACGSFSGVVRQVAVHGPAIALVTTDAHVVRSGDSGAHWATDDVAADVLSVTAGPASFFLGSDRGAWRAAY